MGTNPGGMSGTQFKAPLDYYVDACLAMGAKVILTSYTPHGCVEGYEYVYDKQHIHSTAVERMRMIL